MSLAQIFSFQKDEDHLVFDWAVHHGDIFGFENIHIIDHSSSDSFKSKLNVLSQHGVKIHHFEGPFTEKKNAISEIMLKHSGECSYVVPLDADEFMVLKNKNRIDCSNVESGLRSASKKAKNKMHIFKPMCATHRDPLVENNVFRFINSLDTRVGMSKTFYPSHVFKKTDQGNHHGFIVPYNNTYCFTDLALIHFEIFDLEKFKQKVLRGVEVYSLKEKFKDYRGRGQHYAKAYESILENNFEEYVKCEIETCQWKSEVFESSVFSNHIQSLREKHKSIYDFKSPIA
jgi:hypothetical protein